MTWKKLLVVALAVLALSLIATPNSKAGVSIGIGIGVPVGYSYGCGYAPAYYPYAYRPYGYYRPVVGLHVRPHYHWNHHRRVLCGIGTTRPSARRRGMELAGLVQLAFSWRRAGN